jgi:hypothetical protein
MLLSSDFVNMSYIENASPHGSTCEGFCLDTSIKNVFLFQR